MAVETKHTGYGRYNVLFNGVKIGRAWRMDGVWRFQGWVDGVEVNIFGRKDIETAAQMAADMYEAAKLPNKRKEEN